MPPGIKPFLHLPLTILSKHFIINEPFYFHHSIISFIFIENKCLSDLMGKEEKQVWQKLGSIELKAIASCFTPYTTDTSGERASFVVLFIPTRHWLMSISSANKSDTGYSRNSRSITIV